MVEVLELTAAVARARARWRYRGNGRPPFAEPVAAGEESVWDYPRPPRLEPVAVRLTVSHRGQVLAAGSGAVRVLETAGAPTYYFPPQDVDCARFTDLPDLSLCEWKGLATSFCLTGEHTGARAVGWRYDQTFAEFVAIRGWYSFYPGVLTCCVGAEQARPQPGGYYGGWLTDRLRGPIKGLPGSEGW